MHDALRDFARTLVTHGENTVRVLQSGNTFYFPLAYQIRPHDRLQAPKGTYEVLDAMWRPNSTVVEARTVRN